MIVPDSNSEENKKQQVSKMFDHIAKRYDFLNHFLSLGIDKIWRRKVRRLAQVINPKKILDVATGTGDLAIELSKIGEDVNIIGIDIAEKMLIKGREKLIKKKLDHRISFYGGDAENIKFDDNEFDIATVAFGARNYENLLLGLKEMCRVLKKEGKIIVLEFSKPRKFPIKHIYLFYFKNLLPFIGRVFSKDKNAYKYLHDSVLSFPDSNDFLGILSEAGFKNTQQYRLSFGISTIYIGQKV